MKFWKDKRTGFSAKANDAVGERFLDGLAAACEQSEQTEKALVKKLVQEGAKIVHYQDGWFSSDGAGLYKLHPPPYAPYFNRDTMEGDKVVILHNHERPVWYEVLAVIPWSPIGSEYKNYILQPLDGQ